jgi:hypothetical protein
MQIILVKINYLWFTTDPELQHAGNLKLKAVLVITQDKQITIIQCSSSGYESLKIAVSLSLETIQQFK